MSEATSDPAWKSPRKSTEAVETTTAWLVAIMARAAAAANLVGRDGKRRLRRFRREGRGEEFGWKPVQGPPVRVSPVTCSLSERGLEGRVARMRRYVFMVSVGQKFECLEAFFPPSLTSSRCETLNVILGEVS